MKTVVLLAIAAPALLLAQGGRGGGRGPAGPPPTGKGQAPWDPSGYYVSMIVDEWRFRVTPIKGDILYMPLNAEARRVANAWDPAKDESSGNQCKAYGAVGVMQRPGRLHISWQDDNTLKIETDAGTQTRIFHFVPSGSAPLPNSMTLPPDTTVAPRTAAAGPSGPPSLQGYSIAMWEGPGFGGGGRGFGAPRPTGPPKTGTMKIVTTNMTPGYLRKNGVPYSDKAVLTEYINVVDGQQNDHYIAVTAMVDDPVYLTGPFVRTYQFKKVADATGWDPTPCWTR